MKINAVFTRKKTLKMLLSKVPHLLLRLTQHSVSVFDDGRKCHRLFILSYNCKYLYNCNYCCNNLL
jgi:hypothetical protein